MVFNELVQTIEFLGIRSRIPKHKLFIKLDLNFINALAGLLLSPVFNSVFIILEGPVQNTVCLELGTKLL